jgi:hypothetical protein
MPWNWLRIWRCRIFWLPYSFGEGCAYGLNQHTIEIQAAQQFLEGSALVGFGGVVGLLRQGDADGPGLHRDLGDIDAVGRRP